VSHGIIQRCASKFSTFLYSSVFSQLAWAYFCAAIIMIFVSCTNINRYLRNYQDCLILDGLHQYSAECLIINSFQLNLIQNLAGLSVQLKVI
jgi:hypothetical protein